MLKRLYCWLFGHDTIRKAYTGETMESWNPLFGEYTANLFRFEHQPMCLRCGSPNPHYKPEGKSVHSFTISERVPWPEEPGRDRNSMH